MGQLCFKLQANAYPDILGLFLSLLWFCPDELFGKALTCEEGAQVDGEKANTALHKLQMFV